MVGGENGGGGKMVGGKWWGENGVRNHFPVEKVSGTFSS